MYHPGGYGGISASDCVMVKGFKEALCIAFRGDNEGPPGVAEVIEDFEILEKEFPNAIIRASTFDIFIHNLIEFNPILPSNSKEIGGKINFFKQNFFFFFFLFYFLNRYLVVWYSFRSIKSSTIQRNL